jgi:glycosyltransferase involved in cell wall biosynthesis
MHVHSLIWAGLGAAKIKASTGTPYLVTEHRGRFVNNQFVDTTEKLEMALPELRVALASAQKVLCVSSVLRPYLTNLCPNVDIGVLANMVDTPKAAIQKKASNQSTFNFICVGNIVPLKGHKTLVDAFAALLKQELAIKLTIVGDGWHRQEVEAHVRSLGIDNHVHFMGYVEHSEVTEHLLQADAFVLPSQYEAFGVVYIEAMSLGLPVIATHSGGAVDFVNPSNGLLVHPDDVKGLSEAMYQMMVNIERYDASYISHYVEKHFSKSVIAKRLSGELSAIIGK